MNSLKHWVNLVLLGIGQIMLQENRLTGLLFLIGVALGSWWMALAMLLATFIGTLTAKVLHYKEEEINAGLYGFSAALVGVALLLFFYPSIILGFFLILGAFLASVIQHYFIQKKILVFTLPFVLVTWVLLFFLAQSSRIEAIPSTVIPSQYLDYSFILRGYGQVIFQDKLLSGILFFFGVLLSSPIAAIYALLASLVSGLIAYYFGIALDTVMLGLFGYNAVLCAIVFAGKQWKNIVWSIISVLLSVVIALSMSYLKLIQFTFPFVLATMLTLGIQKLSHKTL